MKPIFCLICGYRLGARNKQNNIHKGCAKKFKHCIDCKKYVANDEEHTCRVNILHSLFARELGMKYKVSIEKIVKMKYKNLGVCRLCDQAKEEVLNEECEECHLIQICKKIVFCMNCDLVCGCGVFSTYLTCYFCGSNCCNRCNEGFISEKEIFNCHIVDCKNCILNRCVNRHNEDVCRVCLL